VQDEFNHVRDLKKRNISPSFGNRTTTVLDYIRERLHKAQTLKSTWEYASGVIFISKKDKTTSV
jgi:hypothetical protein